MKYAVVGSNFIAHSFAEAITRTESEIVAIYSRTNEAGSAFQRAWNIKTLHTDFDEMLANKDVEAVYIATPNTLHFPQGKRVLQAGKHLLLEKPATITVSQFEQLQEIASKNNLAFLEAMRPHFIPTYKEIKKRLPELGTIRRVSLNFHKYSSRYDDFKNGIVENAFKKELGNGALMDIGVYPISVLAMLFGAPKTITAKSTISENSIDLFGDVIFEYQDFNAVVSYSKIGTGYQQNEIQGEKGAILFHASSKPKSFALKTEKSEETFNCVETDNNMNYEIDFHASCAKNPSLANPSNEWTKITLKIMEEIRSQIGYEFE